MTATLTPPVVEDPAPHRRPGGGLPARRAVVRWAVRMLRREWRQQVLALTLLTVAVAGTTVGVTATYNMASSSDAQFGRAQQLIRFEGSDPARLAADLDAARSWFGPLDLIGHRYRSVPGLFQPVDIRAQDPAGAYGAPMLALRQGRYPRGAGELAVTDATAQALHVAVGGRVSLDGRDRLVVGLVENPKNLADEFALVDPAGADPPQSVTLLVGADRSNVDAFRATIGGDGVRESRPEPGRGAIAAITLALASIGLLLVSLVAGAAFVVVAQRRLRQLGLLASVGATRRQLRLVLLANGTVIGTVAAVSGTAVGLAGWLVAAGWLETSAGHRINRFDLPWPALAASVGLAVATATVASWWPARAIARIPIVSALASRPPRPRPARRSAWIAVGLLALGVTALGLSNGANPALIIAGTIGTAIGMLFLGPLAIRALALARTGMPVAVRLALNDLVRYQARAGAALAAISLGLAISVAIVAGSAAAEENARAAAGLGNLADSQLLIRALHQGGTEGPMVPDQTPAQLADRQTRLDAIVSLLGGATVIRLDAAVDPNRRVQDAGQTGLAIVEFGPEAPANTPTPSNPLFVATPELLHLYGADAVADADLLSVRTDPLQLLSRRTENDHPNTRHLDSLGYTALPDTLITTAALARYGWSAAPAGWFLQSGHSLTPQQLDRAQELAAGAGLTIESRRAQTSLTALRTGATGAGILLALAILATTVGLIRGESAGDLRTLTATGAPRRIRRSLAATTAGALALLGAVLGLSGAYLGLVGVLHRHLGLLATPPLAHLATIVIGLPVLAAAAGWLLAGRQPRFLARRPLD